MNELVADEPLIVGEDNKLACIRAAELAIKPEGDFWDAWYSSEQAKHNGYVIYLGTDGKEVQVTIVTRGPDHHAFWEDMQFVGFVTKFIKRIKQTSIRFA